MIRISGRLLCWWSEAEAEVKVKAKVEAEAEERGERSEGRREPSI